MLHLNYSFLFEEGPGTLLKSNKPLYPNISKPMGYGMNRDLLTMYSVILNRMMLYIVMHEYLMRKNAKLRAANMPYSI